MTTEQLVAKAQEGSTVYITDVSMQFDSMADRIQLICELELIDDSRRIFPICVPDQQDLSPEANAFVSNYICARIYNILSSLGGRRMTIYLDREHAWLNRMVNELDEKFGISRSREERKGYGRSINVIDRITNDGPMASFTAAVEQSVSSQPDRIADGVFAHTLGTEL